MNTIYQIIQALQEYWQEVPDWIVFLAVIVLGIFVLKRYLNT